MMDKPWWWQASLIVLGVLAGAGIIFLVTRPQRGQPVELLPPPTEAPIEVYVSGGVNKPGLYSLPVGSRVDDAIQAAGGYTASANTGTLNLAALLEDGEQVRVPELLPTAAPGSQNRTIIPTLGLIDINQATIEQLDTLPGIGPVTAQAIIDYRSKDGPFSKVEDILDVPGIGQVTFDKIKDLITVGTSP